MTRWTCALIVCAITAATVSRTHAGTCVWDTDLSGSVDVADLLDLLGLWGTNPGGPPDFDGDGDVGVTDLLAMLGRWGPCPSFISCGDGTAGSCLVANGTPGCNNQACCETVCAVDSNCCTVAWDATCKDLANSLCGTCGDPGAGDCCTVHATGGCDDAACCRTVCELDQACCTQDWDQLCVDGATALCGCP